ncbi:MAG: EF-hand domain-containing protein [Thiobacillus sp.]
MQSINHRFRTLALAGVLGVITSAPVLAASTAPDFKKYDVNGDGKISLQEYQARGGAEEAFRMIDANGDNIVSHDEFVKKDSPSSNRATPASPATPDPNGRL